MTSLALSFLHSFLFPSSPLIPAYRKDCLARNMSKMAKVRPDEYSFVPKTWIFPSEYSAFVNNATELKKKKKHKTFIVKPANGAMGNGIHLYRSAEKVGAEVL